MVSSGTKEHLDFLSHCDEDKSPESKDLEFEKIKETTPDEVQEIKLNLAGSCPYKKPVDIKVRKIITWTYSKRLNIF